jgi:dephospho-CoA kinase
VGRWANKYVIGLTGNIAMGKSLVRKYLENLGAYTIDADGLAHQAMAPGAPTYAPIVKTFGEWILDADKKIDRSRLGAVVFAHNDALNILEQITHPIVGQAIDILISRAKQPIVVVEAIKLVDGVLGSQVDTVWVVDSPPDIQLQRMMSKRNMPEWEARKRIETQNPQAEKLAKAQVIIRNNGTPEEVWTQVQSEWTKLLTALRAGSRPAAPAAQPAPPAAKPAVGSAAPAPPAAPATARPSTPAVSPVQPPMPAPAPAPMAAIEVKRGNPRNAEIIAKMLTQATGKGVSRGDIMMAFGEKSYLLAESGTHTFGLAGFQVENLITRVDEFFIMPDAPLDRVAAPLIVEIEEASKELQSEVGFIFMPRTANPVLIQAFLNQGYEKTEIEQLKVPAWREAAQELYTPDRQVLMKKLRAERVLKPV